MVLDEALSSIAERLRDERTRAGLTLDQLAQRAELSTPHLSRLESGERQPSIAALLSLARALGVSMSTLLGERRRVPAIGRIVTIPARHQRRRLLLDKIAQAFEPGVRYSERRVSLFLGSIHPDYAALRRYLVDEDFLSRAGGEYWRSGGTVPDRTG